MAIKAASSCMSCRRRRKATAQQIMGNLPPQALQQSSPFNTTCLDLFGPLVARGIGGHARKLFKTWGVVFVCVASKAVALWLAADYGADSFMLCFRKQASIYGKPTVVFSDKGSQLLAAGKDLEQWDVLGNQVRALGTQWEYTPTACPWRNGQSERCVALAKYTLQHLITKYATLNFTELETTLIQVGEIMNRRPLAVRHFEDTDFHPITPADLLLGRVHGYRPVL